MKKFIFSYLGLLCAFGQLAAQIADRSLTTGFLSDPQFIKPYGAEQWIVVGRSVPFPGALFQDTLYWVIVDQGANVVRRGHFDIDNSEIHYFHDLLVLPDGSVVASFESTLCDVGSDVTVVQKIGPDGDVHWMLSDNFDHTVPLPNTLKAAPDGNILGFGDGKVFKINQANGESLWTWNFPNVDDYSDYDLVAGTEDFVTINYYRTQFWKQQNAGSNPSYTGSLLHESELGRIKVRQGPDGWFYTLGQYQVQGERFNLSGGHDIWPLPSMTNAQDFDLSGDALYYLGGTSTANVLVKTNLTGQLQTEYPMPGLWEGGFCVAVKNDNIAIAGVDGSGPNSDLSIPPYGFRATNLWLRTFTGTDTAPANLPINTAATAVQLGSPLLIEANNNVYNLSGGGYRVQVTNNSTQSNLTEVRLNIRFERNVYMGICFNYPAQQRIFSGLSIAPGQSAWLEFGDIEAVGQLDLPEKLCFWTSAPNAQPDDFHDDDYACIAAIVPTNTPTQAAAWTCSPNPTLGLFTVQAPAQFTKNDTWHLFDAMGRVVKTGQCPSGSTVFSMDLKGLPAGMYGLRCQGKQKRVFLMDK